MVKLGEIYVISKGQFKHKNNNVSNASENRRITAFAFSKHEGGVEINIIGCFQIKQAPSQPFYSKGIITVDGRPFSVFDLQALAGMKAKKVTSESCIVLLDCNDEFNFFSRAIIVDDVTEMLSIADHSMTGVGIENLFGSQLQISGKDASPDFPEIGDQKTGVQKAHGLKGQRNAYA